VYECERVCVCATLSVRVSASKYLCGSVYVGGLCRNVEGLVSVLVFV
jgi:hypothetical protein